MQEKISIAQRYLSLHRKWRRLRKKQRGMRPSWELVTLQSTVNALAWVLGADPYDGVGQPYGATDMSVDGKSPPRGVRLTGVWQETQRFRGRPDSSRYWLLEIPASESAQTEYWAVFLTEEQVADLGRLFAAALFGSNADALNRLAAASGQASGQASGHAERIDEPSVGHLREFLERRDWSAPDRQAQTQRTRKTGGAA